MLTPIFWALHVMHDMRNSAVGATRASITDLQTHQVTEGVLYPCKCVKVCGKAHPHARELQTHKSGNVN